MNSFQLAKFLSQLIASRRRKTPVHLDGEERKKRERKVAAGSSSFIACAWPVRRAASAAESESLVGGDWPGEVQAERLRSAARCYLPTCLVSKRL